MIEILMSVKIKTCVWNSYNYQNINKFKVYYVYQHSTTNIQQLLKNQTPK